MQYLFRISDFMIITLQSRHDIKIRIQKCMELMKEEVGETHVARNILSMMELMEWSTKGMQN